MGIFIELTPIVLETDEGPMNKDECLMRKQFCWFFETNGNEISCRE